MSYGELYTSITELSNHDVWVAYGDSEVSSAYVVELKYNGDCTWTKQAPLNVTDAPIDNFGGSNVDLFSCPDDSLHLLTTWSEPSLSVPYLVHHVCRAGVANCSIKDNWNASNNSAQIETITPDDFHTRTDYVGVCAPNNDFSIFSTDGNDYEEDLWKFANTGAGTWDLEYAFNHFFVFPEGGTYWNFALSAAYNSSGALLAAWTNQLWNDYADIVFSYCDSGLNCSQNESWTKITGAPGYDTVNINFGEQPALVVSNLSGGVQILWSEFNEFISESGDPNSTLYLSYPGLEGWVAPIPLTNPDTENQSAFPAVWSSEDTSIPFAWYNGSFLDYPFTGNVLFNTYPTSISTLSITVSSPKAQEYLSSTINALYSFVSNNFASANCTSYLDDVIVNSTILVNGTNQTDVLSGYGLGSHSFNVTCFNASVSSSKIVNFSFISMSNSLTVFCFDETTGNPLSCNIGASNATNYTSIANDYYLNTLYPTGSLTLTANKSGFYNRSSAATFTGAANVSANIYLLNTSDSNALYVRIHVQTVNFAPVTDATVIISKYFGLTLTTLASLHTDGTGTAAFYLDSTTNYVVSVVSPAFGSTSLNLVPSSNDVYITLGGGSGGIGNYTYSFPAWCYDNVSASYIPVSNNLFLGDNYVNFTIAASDSQLAFWGWSFYVGDSLVDSVNNTNASGGVLSYLLNYNESSNATGNASFNVFWSRNNVTGYCNSYVFLRVFNMSSSGVGLVQAMQNIKSGTALPAFGFELLVLLITALIIAFAARYTAVGGAIIGVVVLSVFALGNWISWEVYLMLTIIGLLGSYFIFSRGY